MEARADVPVAIKSLIGSEWKAVKDPIPDVSATIAQGQMFLDV